MEHTNLPFETSRAFTSALPSLSTRVAAPDSPTPKVQPRLCFRAECRVVDLITSLGKPEGKTLEFKRDLSSPDGVLKTIVAFANTSGRVVCWEPKMSQRGSGPPGESNPASTLPL